jgi:hypothetical protein
MPVARAQQPASDDRRRAVGRGHGVGMLLEAATFGVAAVLHLDARFSLVFVTVRGERVGQAAVGELIVAGVLVVGAIVVLARPADARRLACVVTGFAIFGVIVGLLTIALGVGPRTIPDLVYQVAIMTVLLISFAVLMNRRRG